MPIDLNALGSKLKRYRGQLQASLSEVAAATGIPADRLEGYEQGDIEPSGDDILILADYFKCDYRFFVSNERLAPFEQTETLFRTHGKEFPKADRVAVQEFLYLCDCEQFLTDALAGPVRRPFSFKKKGRVFKDHGREAAAELRSHLGYRSHEVGMDVYHDFRVIGLHVFRRQLENSRISGLCIRHPTAGPCILVNYDEDIYRQRFSVAHEAAHAILDADQDVVISLKRWTKGDLKEIRANTFASDFLMPPEFLKGIPDAGNWNEAKAIEWAARLKVSTTALANALDAAGIVARGTTRMLRRVTVPAAQKRDPELPESLPPKSRERRAALLRNGLSTYYADLCFRAYDENIVSAGRLAEMLLADPQQIDETALGYGRSLTYAD